MIFYELNDKNFLFYAIKCYKNEQCEDVKEFYDDLKRFQYLKKLFVRYETKNQLKINLILNHIIIICNVFDINPAIRMLLYKLDKKHHKYIKPFLIFLKYLSYDNPELSMNNIKEDLNITNNLKEL